MQSVRKKVKDFYYKYLQKFTLFRTLVLVCKITARGEWLEGSSKSPSWCRDGETRVSIKHLRIAMICDDMTWQNFQGICELVYLTPDNWFNELNNIFSQYLFFFHNVILSFL